MIAESDRIVNATLSGWNLFHQLRRRLHRDGQFAYYWTPDTGQFYDAGGAQLESKRSFWFPADKTPAAPASWTGNNFFGVHPTTSARQTYQRSRIQDIAAINCVFAEIDGKDMVTPTEPQLAAALATVQADEERRVAAGELKRPNPHATQKNTAYRLAQETEFKRNIPHYNQLAHERVMNMTPAPSAIIYSGGGYHLYWLLSETFHINTDEDRTRAKRLQQKWVTFVGGDDGAKDLARVLRIIGTPNKKAKYAPNYPIVSALRMDLTQEYALAELESLLPADPEKPSRRRSAGTPAAHSPASCTEDQPGDIGSYDTIWGAYNAAHRITATLEHIGYTRHGERYLRPGAILGDSSPSVVVDDLRNTATTFSSSDPLFNEDYRPNSPFDILRIYDHDGDFKAATVAAAKELGMELALPEVAAGAIQTMTEWLVSVALTPYVVRPEEDQGKPYHGAHADKVIFGAILDGMRHAGRAWRFRTSYRQLATNRNSDGVPGMQPSTATVGKALKRLAFAFDVRQEEGRTVISLRRDFALAVGLARRAKVNSSKEPPVFFDLFSYARRELEPAAALFNTWKCDDAFATGSAPLPRSAWQAMKQARERDAFDPENEEPDRAGYGDRKAFEAAFPAGLSVFAIAMIHALMENGECTYADLCEASGATRSRASSIMRTLERFGGVEAERAPFTPTVFTLTRLDAFQWIHDDVAPKLRTYGQGVNRLDRDLEKQIAHNERRLGGDLTEEEAQRLTRQTERAKGRRREMAAALTALATTGGDAFADAWDALTMQLAALLGGDEATAQAAIGESIPLDNQGADVDLPSHHPMPPVMDPGAHAAATW